MRKGLFRIRIATHHFNVKRHTADLASYWKLKPWFNVIYSLHYSDVTMTPISSQITSASFVYSTVCSGAVQRKHQSSASLAPVNSPHKVPVTRKMFPFDDVIMDLYNLISIPYQKSKSRWWKRDDKSYRYGEHLRNIMNNKILKNTSMMSRGNSQTMCKLVTQSWKELQEKRQTWIVKLIK